MNTNHYRIFIGTSYYVQFARTVTRAIQQAKRHAKIAFHVKKPVVIRAQRCFRNGKERDLNLPRTIKKPKKATNEK